MSNKPLIDFEDAAGKKDLLSYFERLKGYNFDIEEFKTHWSALEDGDHSPESLHIYLRTTAKTFSCIKKLNKKSALKAYLDDNIQLWTHKASEKGLDNFTPCQTADIFWSFAKLNIWPGHDFISKWGMAAGRFTDIRSDNSFTAHEISQILYATCLFDAQNEDMDLSDTVSFLLDKMEAYAASRKIDWQVYTDACRWVGKAPKFPLPQGTGKVSEHEKILGQWLSEAGADISAGRTIPSSEVTHNIDLPIYWKGFPVLIEFDGPFHFNRDPSNQDYEDFSYYNSSTAFQTKLLEKLHPDTHILRFRFTEFDILNDIQNERKRLSSLRVMLDRLVAQPHGSYVSRADNKKLYAEPKTTAPKHARILGMSQAEQRYIEEQARLESPHGGYNPLAALS